MVNIYSNWYELIIQTCMFARNLEGIPGRWGHLGKFPLISGVNKKRLSRKNTLIGCIQVVDIILTNNPCKPSHCSSLLKKWWANWQIKIEIILNVLVPKLTGNANLLGVFQMSGMSSSQIGSVVSRHIHSFIFMLTTATTNDRVGMCFAKRLGHRKS